jgi:hypothetical protein
MTLYSSNITDAYSPILDQHWEKKENIQHYDKLISTYVHPTPKRHLLGILDGNNVSLIKGNMVDLESDLRGITIPNTSCPWRQYQPPQPKQKEINRDNVKGKLTIDIQRQHLPVFQMFGLPAVIAPLPLKNEVCKNPERY